MQKSDARPPEVVTALRNCRSAFIGIGLFSGVLNLLALNGSIYMLQVYDRVLGSRSLETLVGLSVLMVGIFAALGVLDALRSRLLSRVGMRFERALRDRSFAAVLQLPLVSRRAGGEALQPIRDLDQVRGFLSGPGPVAIFDAPWLPIYLALVYILHPWLGLLAIGGAVVLAIFTLFTEWRTMAPATATQKSAMERDGFGNAAARNTEIIRASGMSGRMGKRWSQLTEDFYKEQMRAIDATSTLGSASRVFRMVLQSAVLGLGAYVVIKGEATGGVMIAASILTSRALAPIEIAIGNWRAFVAARQSYERLVGVLKALPQDKDRLALPRPKEALVVQSLGVAPPGEQRLILQDLTFDLKAGDGLGVIGPAASGKTTLARALVGAWVHQRGTIRLDKAALDQYSPDALGIDIGYLPQSIELFEGTVAENISRGDTTATPEAVIAAARAAGAHDMILQLDGGYNANIGDAGAKLSAGQRQRVALARALYGDPFLVVLDEPNSNLDNDGDNALTAAIASVRVRGGIVIVIAHRPSAVAAVDKLMVLNKGRLQAYGSKEEVRAKLAAAAAEQQAGRQGPQQQQGQPQIPSMPLSIHQPQRSRPQ